MFVRSGEIPSPGQTSSIDKSNDCAMKSERGALVKGSDPPSGHSVHKTAGDTWRAPARRLIQTHLGAAVSKTSDKKSRSLSHGKRYRPLFRFGRREWDVAGNFSPPRPRIHLIYSRPSSAFIGLARHEAGWPWVESMSKSKAYHRLNCFFISVLTIFNVNA